MFFSGHSNSLKMKKIVFTKEHLKELKELYVSISFEGKVLSGKFNANTLNPYELLHSTNIDTLVSLREQLKKEVTASEEADEFTLSEEENKGVAVKKNWHRFLHLIIGHKRYLEQRKKLEKELAGLRSKAKQLEEENMTPAEKLKALQDEIKEKSEMLGEGTE